MRRSVAAELRTQKPTNHTSKVDFETITGAAHDPRGGNTSTSPPPVRVRCCSLSPLRTASYRVTREVKRTVKRNWKSIKRSNWER